MAMEHMRKNFSIESLFHAGCWIGLIRFQGDLYDNALGEGLRDVKQQKAGAKIMQWTSAREKCWKSTANHGTDGKYFPPIFVKDIPVVKQIRNST